MASFVVAFVVLATVCGPSPAGDAPGAGCISTSAPAPANDAGTVGLYAALETGMVDAKVIARDAYHLRVFLRNAGKEAVRLQLPTVIAARPVALAAAQDPAKQHLAQQNFFNPGANPGGGTFGQNSQGGAKTQAVSGPTTFGITANSANNQQGQNNVFAIPPESTREFRVATVCVEHGKPNPRSIVKYELVKPEKVGVGPELADALVSYGRGESDREAMQAAAWHLANGKTWDELRKMSRMTAVNAQTPIFTSQELAAARRLVEASQQRIAAKNKANETKSSTKLVALPKL
ncbi:MAG: hypothetical protein C0483_03265 [Pirellula sp.]|nr:hypothetical protein [Pirellula sp.]